MESTTVAAGTDHYVGETGLLTARVSADGPTPGRVQFYIDGESYEDPVPLVDGHAELVVTGLAAGTYEVTAEYLPDAGGPLPSTSEPATFTVSQAPAPPCEPTPPAEPTPTPTLTATPTPTPSPREPCAPTLPPTGAVSAPPIAISTASIGIGLLLTLATRRRHGGRARQAQPLTST
ncbi:Ig-like domain repeat protein [Streptomyces sp. PSKA54]|uniref:Ig-like domain repeat protein n=1 Tax=Streptomyces himalayensis subsp. aureolus TaxID=2758039 RepID=A0A7W2D4G5_9ACTN|nr:Ig-like domain repeat protein [Streptomyces himalayensis subsp. aureolus]